MPIKGLTDRPRFPRLGKIRTGELVESNNGKTRHPKQYDHFLLPDNLRRYLAPNGERVDVLSPIYIATEDMNHAASTYYRAYTRRGLMCRGDGETANRTVDLDALERTGDLSIAGPNAKRVGRQEVSCPCELLQKGDCKPLMMLQFFMPTVPLLGIWQIDTASINSIVNVHSFLNMLRTVAGRISGIPLSLHLVPHQSQVDNSNRTVYVLELRLPDGFDLLDLRERVRALASGTVAALQAPTAEAVELEDPENEPPDPSLLVPRHEAETGVPVEEPETPAPSASVPEPPEEMDGVEWPPVPQDDGTPASKEDVDRAEVGLKALEQDQEHKVIAAFARAFPSRKAGTVLTAAQAWWLRQAARAALGLPIEGLPAPAAARASRPRDEEATQADMNRMLKARDAAGWTRAEHQVEWRRRFPDVTKPMKSHIDEMVGFYESKPPRPSKGSGRG